MEDSIFWMILLQIVLIGLNAVFACAEIAVISMNDNRLAKLALEGDKRAVRLERLTAQPARFLATIQVAITLSGFLGSAFAAEHFSDVLVKMLVRLGVPISVKVLDSLAVVLITVILSYFTLVFGELVPKQAAMRKAEPLALGMSALISGIARMFAPIVFLLTASTNGILRLLGIDPDVREEQVSEEEIRMMVDVGSEKGAIDHEEKEFIQNVFEFDDLAAGEILTHRTDVVMLDVEDSMEEWQDIIYGSRHTLYPVCEGSPDRIIGILDAGRYFRLENQDRKTVMERAVHPAYFIPDTVKADTLFRNMKQKKQTMAVVLDEYGGMSGIITIKDLVERLVGDICFHGEEEEEETTVKAIEEGVWLVPGSAWIKEVSEVLGTTLPCEDCDTFSGLILHALGSIPEDGTDMELEVAGLRIQVTQIRNHQVGMAVVSLLRE
ncbi:MAG: HlyC/CorC family transporter [Lachnospiraceae bacterium]|nr:HlyC/CorC family transporter [Lachnospiraceae bacterium]